MRKLQLTVLLAVVGSVLALSAGIAAAAKPSAANDTVKTNVNTRVVIDVLANDHATGGEQLDPTSLNINAFPNVGNLEVTPDEKLAYTPAPGFVGVDPFSYLVCSKQSPTDCAIATVNVTVGNPNATTTTTVPVTVAAAPPPPPAPAPAPTVNDSALPRTGSASALLAIIGAALCVLGFALTRWRAPRWRDAGGRP
jgi:hypothetical protein